jgi:DNA-binding CsgD family transcriptional regulator
MITPAIPPEGLFEFRPDFQLSRWRLTKRETEVVEGILLGLSNKEIAAELGMRLPTLKGHLLRIGDKLGIDSKRYALRTRCRQDKIHLVSSHRNLFSKASIRFAASGLLIQSGVIKGPPTQTSTPPFRMAVEVWQTGSSSVCPTAVPMQSE